MLPAYNGNKSANDQIFQRSLDEENRKNIDILHQNINELQSIGIEIKDFIINEKKSLNTMQNTYDSSNSLLNLTMQKIDFLMNSNYGRITCYLVLMVILVLIILYFLKP